MKSALDYKDRQDPSLVYEVAKLHVVITDTNNKQTFLAVYLKMICFLMEAFFEHDLDITQRLFRIHCCGFGVFG